MVFVPLPLFATLCLAGVLIRFVTQRDMRVLPHLRFAALIALYAVQSLLVSLRWGYGLDALAIPMAVLAPVLPAVAYLAYKALSGRQMGARLWPLGVVAANWAVFALAPDLTDLVIIATYLGFGFLLIWLYQRGTDEVTLSPLGSAREIMTAMGLTGAALVASAAVDIYVIYDFITNDGRSAGLVLTFAQTALILVIGIAALFGKATQAEEADEPAAAPAPQTTQEDAIILQRLEALFTREGLHKTEDLSLRRLARRLGVPDRHVSNAVNRTQQMSVSQFVNAQRIKDACALLRDTDDTVLSISLDAGFATKSNFNREFSRVTGQTPSQWRKAARA